jgi:2-polyprenyl-6-methoxyphenol hydroxylase-like FAD-dependent oxidoreductase
MTGAAESNTARDYDAVVVGASIAGTTTAMLLAGQGASVALVERSSDPAAFKRICGHYIQASGVPTLERLGLLDEIEALGGVRSHVRMRTPWGIVEPPGDEAPRSLNIRREVLDPLLRERAAATPGVELLLGLTVDALTRDGDAFTGVEARRADGERVTLSAPLVVGADGRGSRVAELGAVDVRTHPNGRFAYAAYYETGEETGTDATIWMLDPQWAAAFPTDAGLTLYGCMLTKEHLPEFKSDLGGAFERFLSSVPGGPPLSDMRRVGPVMGKVEMPNTLRGPTAPGLALAGDAALATDPLWGVGCGWALQTGEWLADAVGPALTGGGSLERGLASYRRRFRRGLGLHARMIDQYASGRRFDSGERMIFSAAVHDRRLAATMNEYGTRRISPVRMLSRSVPRAAMVHAKRAIRRERRPAVGVTLDSAA